ncbi:hypothetical protein [Cupriavidus basilensis]|nr:hypothetical protein [Cupriavidus basilensis]
MMGLLWRVLPRVVWSAALTIVAFLAFQPLTMLTGVPEVARVLPALAVLYWIELSLFLARVIFSPDIDHQAIARKAAEESSGAAMVFAVQTFSVMFRVGILVWIIFAL